MSQRLLGDAQLKAVTVNALRLSHEFVDLIREGYSQDSLFHWDEGEWTKDSRIEAIAGTFGVSIAFVSRGTLSSN
jgi:phage/plasmid-associated DNA primase